MAVHQLALVVTKVHTSTTTELPYLAVAALVTLGPLPIAVLLEAVLPYVPEPIAVYVTLCVVSSHACATRYVAIHAD